ncbi:hypothetical protein [Ruegeria arenilitoris]|uniref:hypothetical protein n=1 Tax=Ruegeria arenilitoris TaxID=1173585 RepID=UPI00147C76C6|nr:hypothetical protein [Ruegeria arenilitoris]
MTAIFNQVCEAVSECANLTERANEPFWDLKAILAAIGISIALVWNCIQYFSGKSRRNRDKQWEMFRDEIYSPFLELLNSFEQEIRPAQLAVRLSDMDRDALADTIGQFFGTVSEMEVLCQRADNHVYTSHSNFFVTFQKFSTELESCIDRLLNSGAHPEGEFESVSRAFRNLIDGLRTCLSNCRKDLH